MTLEFDREIIIVNGFPIMGTVTVEADGLRDPSDGLWQLYLAVTRFEAEDGRKLTWGEAIGPCDAWLVENRARVEKEALK